MSARGEQERLTILVHEVRSPVAALSAIAETFRGRGLDVEERRTLAGLAAAACRGIERVVSDAAVGSLDLATVEPGKLVDQVAATWRLTGGNVEARYASDVASVIADPIRIRQALDNLVSNALAYARTEEPVVVSAIVKDGELRLSVVDAGVGIPTEEQQRIFEAGVRLDTGRPGSGLGLAIARSIAEAHGGRLRVESVPGKGSTFTIVLPVPED